MTDGIIQKTFKRFIELHNALPSSQRGYDIWTSFEVIEIQQALIEDIKQEFGRYDEFGCYYYHDSQGKITIRILIGDNKK